MHYRLTGSEYKDIDFSYADLIFYAGDTNITNCLFLESQLTGLRFWNCIILQCDFSHAFMPWFSAGRRTRFVQCIFDHTTIRHHAELFGYARFSDCSFLKLDWRMINFRRCVFEGCVFSGRLRNAHADCSAGYGFDAVRDYLLRLQNKGYNVFKNCSLANLTVIRLSVENGALTLNNCTGFPAYFLPSKEFRADKDFYSENAKSKTDL
jgi:uncharacterized protein YjbI with pentapeptide repeats